MEDGSFVRHCETCRWSKDGHCAGTEECHSCMWENRYEPRVGHWNPIHISNIWESYFSCSECEKSVGIRISLGQRLYNYCPFCGAKMMKGEDKKDEMTRKEAIQKIEFLINSYQKLIDEKVDEGILVGTDSRGVWKADTPLTQAYLEMIEALKIANNSLKVDEKYDLMMEDGDDDTI